MHILERSIFPLLVLAALGSGIVAGLLFIFSNTIMRVLSEAQHPHGMTVMQGINVVIINPLFLAIFLGTAAISAIQIFYALTHWGHPTALYLLCGGLLYLATIGITAMFNIPLNNSLMTFNPADAASMQQWSEYCTRWTFWNHLRTLTAIASLACWIGAAKTV